MNHLIDPSIASQFDRLPPHSVPSEMALLGSLMLADGDRSLFAQVRAVVDRDCFYQADNQIVFDVLVRMLEQGKAIDGLTVREELSRRQLLEEIGGTAYLGQIMHSVPSCAHAVSYAKTVREKSLLRQLIALSNDALRDAYAPASDDAGVQLLANLAAKASRAAAGGKMTEVYRLDVVAREVMARRDTGEVLRVPTGLRDIDRLTGGLRKGGKTIVAGQPGMGKSVLLKQIGRNVARTGTPFGLITVEETRHKVAENALACEANVPNNRVAFGTAGEQEWEALEIAAASLDGIPFFIVDSARELSQIVAMAHVLVCQYHCEVVAVDHLHIIDGKPEKNENREREISRISAELKWVWKDLNVCGIEAAQLNRKDGRDRPNLNSLRDSGSLGQDADTVILLHREDYHRKGEAGYQPDHILEAIIEKNKDGAPGTVPLRFDEARQAATDLDPAIPDYL